MSKTNTKKKTELHAVRGLTPELREMLIVLSQYSPMPMLDFAKKFGVLCAFVEAVFKSRKRADDWIMQQCQLAFAKETDLFEVAISALTLWNRIRIVKEFGTTLPASYLINFFEAQLWEIMNKDSNLQHTNRSH